MADEHRLVEDLLREIALFRGLDDSQLAILAERLELVYLDRSELLFAEGDPGDSLYIVYRGEVQVIQTGVVLATLVSGDYFGEEALLYGRPRSASIVAVGPTALLRVNNALFTELLAESPQFSTRLTATSESHQLAREANFNWLGSGEVVHLVARKHMARLWLTMIGPLVLALFSVPIFFLASLTGTVTPLLFGGLVLILAVLWGIWSVVDWSNDYYIVTNQRVVWLERVVGLYESRQEAPLRTVMAVTMGTDQLGRILGYGDVIVRTYTGSIVMRNVGRPKEFADLVEQYWMRTRQESQEAESQQMVRAIKQHLGMEDPKSPPEPLPEPEFSEADIPQPGILDLILANYFRLRYEEGSVITYRKHWFVLLLKIWQPSLGLLAAGLLLFGRLLNQLTFITLTTTVVVAVALLMAFGAWWLYVFVDWRNDIFQLTSDHIVDIDRRPLGTEQKRSAPLENILSLRHERLGIIGLLLNFGTVTARIGRADFTFDNVHNPAQVQQDIFARMDERLRQKREIETSQERERMAEWLAAYHRNIEEFYTPEPPPDLEEA